MWRVIASHEMIFDEVINANYRQNLTCEESVVYTARLSGMPEVIQGNGCNLLSKGHIFDKRVQKKMKRHL